ncbi:TIGR00296 family protein [Stetteria hydrogenophila]
MPAGAPSGRPVDPDEVTDEVGEYLVRLARRSVEHYLKTGRRLEAPGDVPELARRPGAAFVTIEAYHGPDERELRGCIGYTEPVKPLVDTVIDAALAAAFEDPRFPPLSPSELDTVTFEVTVLSRLEEAPRSPEGRLSFTLVGRDGLVVERGVYKGLLLPQVPVEYGWDEETFLSETCIKAGLWPDCWLDPETRVYRFRAASWREAEPRGRVERRDLRRELEALIGGSG